MSCSLRSDLLAAGPGARAAGEAAGAFPRCDGHGDRTGRAGSPILQGGPLPDVERVGREGRSGRRRGTQADAAAASAAGAVGQTETDAPGVGSRGAGDKVRPAVTRQQTHCAATETLPLIPPAPETEQMEDYSQSKGVGFSSTPLSFFFFFGAFCITVDV